MKENVEAQSSRQTVMLGSNSKVQPFDIPPQQCGNMCDERDQTQFVFWFLSNIVAQQMYS